MKKNRRVLFVLMSFLFLISFVACGGEKGGVLNVIGTLVELFIFIVVVILFIKRL